LIPSGTRGWIGCIIAEKTSERVRLQWEVTFIQVVWLQVTGYRGNKASSQDDFTASLFIKEKKFM